MQKALSSLECLHLMNRSWTAWHVDAINLCGELAYLGCFSGRLMKTVPSLDGKIFYRCCIGIPQASSYKPIRYNFDYHLIHRREWRQKVVSVFCPLELPLESPLSGEIFYCQHLGIHTCSSSGDSHFCQSHVRPDSRHGSMPRHCT